MCSGLFTVDLGWFLSRTVGGTSVLLLHHAESDSALQHLHREPRIDSGLILRLERGGKQLLPETTLAQLIQSHPLMDVYGYGLNGANGGVGVLPMADVAVIVVKCKSLIAHISLSGVDNYTLLSLPHSLVSKA